jgi:hypothetical protein
MVIILVKCSHTCQDSACCRKKFLNLHLPFYSHYSTSLFQPYHSLPVPNFFQNVYLYQKTKKSGQNLHETYQFTMFSMGGCVYSQKVECCLQNLQSRMHSWALLIMGETQPQILKSSCLFPRLNVREDLADWYRWTTHTSNIGKSQVLYTLQQVLKVWITSVTYGSTLQDINIPRLGKKGLHWMNNCQV